jgi:formamidopyrimidine-DNA glycosylase
MPELPDIELYLSALRPRVLGDPLEKVRLASPFVLRTVTPPIRGAEGRRVVELRRLGKRIVFALEGGWFLIVHLMISGRFQWKDHGAKIPGRLGLAAFDFPNGTLLLTEASTQKRASIHLAEGEAALASFDRGGLEPLDAGLAQFRDALVRENHTLKRSLTDPRLFSGIGNAYSDEILHRAQLSPVKLSQSLADEDVARLHRATREVLIEWRERLRAQFGERWPDKVTAFRPEMAVHGKYGEPCPVCGTKVQRIVHAANETNYCPRCQTGGRLLADRALSKLLKQDWPKTIDELEERRGRE